MSYIQSAIELTDRMSAPLYNICTAANMVISNFQAMQSASGAAFDTSSLDVARQNIADAVVQLQELTQEKVKISEPVTIPVQWQEYNAPEVFLTTGAERFQQEIQSANNMMEQLCATQDAIAKQAYSTYVFPPEAFQDLNSMAVRIDYIRDKISQLETSGAGMGFDAANNGIERLREQLSQTLQIQSELNYAVQNMDVSAANSAYLKLSQTVDNTERYIRDNTNEQMQFNNAVYAGTTQTNNLLAQILQIGGAYFSLQSIIGTMKQAVEYASDLAEVQNVVDVTFGSAAQQINEWSQAALDVYGINEVTAKQYTGTMGAMLKSSGLAGGSILEMSTNLTGLAADMASFYNLDTDTAFEKIRSGISGETEPLKQLGINMSVANLEAYAMSQGISEAYSEMSQAEQTTLRYNYLLQVTADAQGDFARTSSSYANQIRLLSENWTEFTGKIASYIIPQLEKLIYKLNNAVTWMSKNNVVQNVAGAAVTVMNIALNAFDLVGSVAEFMVNNWSLIAPLVYGVAAALVVYNATMGIGWLTTLKNAGAHAVAAVSNAAHTAALFATTLAQQGLNAAMAVCPISWIIIGVIALISILFVVCNAIAKTTGVAESGFGVICGAVYVAGAFILNTAIGVLNGLIQSAWNIFVEPVLSIVEWVLNVMNGGFDSFGGAVANLIGNIISWFLSLGKVVTQIIDAIFGTNWTSGLESLQNEVLSWGKTENAITLDRNAPTIDYRIAYGDAFDAGASWGDGISNKVSDFFSGIGVLENESSSGSYGGESDMTNYLSGIAGDTASISDSLDVSEEDLKYLRDIAEQEAINRFTTAEIKVDMSGMSNTVHNTNDLDGIVDGLTTRVLQAMEVVRDGA